MSGEMGEENAMLAELLETVQETVQEEPPPSVDEDAEHAECLCPRCGDSISEPVATFHEISSEAVCGPCAEDLEDSADEALKKKHQKSIRNTMSMMVEKPDCMSLVAGRVDCTMRRGLGSYWGQQVHQAMRLPDLKSITDELKRWWDREETVVSMAVRLESCANMIVHQDDKSMLECKKLLRELHQLLPVHKYPANLLESMDKGVATEDLGADFDASMSIFCDYLFVKCEAGKKLTETVVESGVTGPFKADHVLTPTTVRTLIDKVYESYNQVRKMSPDTGSTGINAYRKRVHLKALERMAFEVQKLVSFTCGQMTAKKELINHTALYQALRAADAYLSRLENRNLDDSKNPAIDFICTKNQASADLNLAMKEIEIWEALVEGGVSAVMDNLSLLLRDLKKITAQDEAVSGVDVESIPMDLQALEADWLSKHGQDINVDSVMRVVKDHHQSFVGPRFPVYETFQCDGKNGDCENEIHGYDLVHSMFSTFEMIGANVRLYCPVCCEKHFPQLIDPKSKKSTPQPRIWLCHTGRAKSAEHPGNVLGMELGSAPEDDNDPKPESGSNEEAGEESDEESGEGSGSEKNPENPGSAKGKEPVPVAASATSSVDPEVFAKAQQAAAEYLGTMNPDEVDLLLILEVFHNACAWTKHYRDQPIQAVPAVALVDTGEALEVQKPPCDRCKQADGTITCTVCEGCKGSLDRYRPPKQPEGAAAGAGAAARNNGAAARVEKKRKASDTEEAQERRARAVKALQRLSAKP